MFSSWNIWSNINLPEICLPEIECLWQWNGQGNLGLYSSSLVSVFSAKQKMKQSSNLKMLSQQFSGTYPKISGETPPTVCVDCYWKLFISLPKFFIHYMHLMISNLQHDFFCAKLWYMHDHIRVINCVYFKNNP